MSVEEDKIESRGFSLHDRFCVVRRNIGYPAIIVAIVAYPTSAALPPHSFLSKRISELQEHFPNLYAVVQGQRTTTPRAVLRDRPWSSDEILSQEEYTTFTRQEEYIALVDQETARIAGHDITSQPSWHVRTHTSKDKAHAYLTLVIDHVFADGRGLIALLDALLADDISSLPFEKLSATPKVEDTLPMKPSMGLILPMIWEKLVVPRLPTFLQNYLLPPAPWPGKNLRGPLVSCPPMSTIYSLDALEVAALKAAAKAHGVKTLHALFQAIYVAALWSRFRHTTAGKFAISTSTPRSERDPALGHLHCTGNFVSSQKLLIEFPPNQDFWSLAKDISNDLASPSALRYGREFMGALSYVPDGVHDLNDPLRPTKWENFFLDEIKSDQPFDQSISISNLGAYKLPTGAEDMVWAQQATPFTQPINVCAIGHEAGVRFMMFWLDGGAVIREDIEEIQLVMSKVVARLINGQEATTLEALASKSASK